MVVGMFGSLVNAQHAVADLVTSGYARNSISVLVRNVGAAPCDDDEEEHGPLARAANALSANAVLAGGPLGAALRAEPEEPAEHAVMHTLTAAGLQPAAAQFFADAICNGAILVAVHCADRYVRDARDILDVYSEPEDGPRTAARLS
jgi:hypothetical protein